jgi:hypothetical protein
LEYSRILTCLNKTAVENILLWRIIDVKKNHVPFNLKFN